MHLITIPLGEQADAAFPFRVHVSDRAERLVYIDADREEFVFDGDDSQRPLKPAAAATLSRSFAP